MKVGITYRLFLAILTATFLAVICIFLVMRWSIDRGFLQYINTQEQKRLTRLAAQLEKSYANNGSWDFLRHNRQLWDELLEASMPDSDSGQTIKNHPETRDKGRQGKDGSPPDLPYPPPPRHFRMPVVLLDAGKQKVIGPTDILGNPALTPLKHRQRIVGYLGLFPRKDPFDVHQLRFLKQQKFALSLSAAILLLLTALLSLPLANRLVRPIRALAEATRRLAAGQYAARVPVTSTDELGRLARDFNALAMTLEMNEEARRQWVADISHELRTPLAVLRGEIEALQDGIRPFTPESTRSLHGEVIRLSRLVDDLYQLSMSDLGALSYRKEDLDLAALLAGVLALYEEKFTRKGIRISEDVAVSGKAMVFGDPERLRQLFANLLDNSLKYTDAGGEVAIHLESNGDQATVDIRDSAPGVPERSLDKLFDRLYRVESSRNRSAGGAGLGLAICRNIVEAHSGTIVAHPSSLGGLWIRISLPLVENCR